MRPKISVVIPVYNAERYVTRCLDSVQNQSLEELEVLCVDDRSTDGTLDILHSRAAKDPRLKIITLPVNSGPAGARNKGIDCASGEYVYFMDSDDWIDSDYLSSMLSEIILTGQDVIVNPEYIEEYESFELKNKSRDLGYTIPEAGYVSPFAVQSLIPPMVYLRMYRRSYLIENNIRFPDFRSGEDIFFTGLAEVLQKRSYIFHGPKYHYLQRERSLRRQDMSGFLFLANYKALRDEVISRGIPIDEMKLFQVGLGLRVDSEEKFIFLHEYCKEILDQVMSRLSIYNVFDVYWVKALAMSADYEDFMSNHGATPALKIVRQSFSHNNNARKQ